MNQEHFKGAWNEFKGELKKTWGKFTDDDLMQIEGDYNKFIGTFQKRYADQKDELRNWCDKWFKDYEMKQTRQAS
jgi:uncharacterized protein YjbJ (UPF0337 family)